MRNYRICDLNYALRITHYALLQGECKVGYDHIRIKNNAKTFYKLNTGSSIAANLIYIGMTLASTIILYILIVVIMGISIVTLIGTVQSEARGAAVATVLGGLFMVIIYAVLLAALFVLFMGMQNWYRMSIYEKTSLGEIFRVFTKDRIMGSFGVTALVMLYTSLWSLLFVIPGIVKYYSYSQAMFIKAEYPDIPAAEALRLSQKMMDGHKADLLYLQLSFLGWFLLSALTYNILGIVYVFPYYHAAMAFAYEEIKAEAISRGKAEALLQS